VSAANFKFNPGDIVKVRRGLEFASPLSGDDRLEAVRIVRGTIRRFPGLELTSYIVKSVSKPERQYVLDQQFIELVEGGNGQTE